MTVQHFLTLDDLGNRATVMRLLQRAAELKRLRPASAVDTPSGGAMPQPLMGKSVALLFEKPSTRTRLSFEAGIFELGGNPISVMSRDLQLGRGEPLSDTAKMLSRFVHAVVFRTTAHTRLEELAAHATIPVVNGLSSDFHPCQILADLQTVQESFGPNLQGLTAAWVGDGNNVSHSWIKAAGLLGFDLRIACPPGYEPQKAVVDSTAKSEATVTVTESLEEAVRGAQVVVTDVWASMGQEEEAKQRRTKLAPYQVDAKCLRFADKDAIFLHCLPAHRGEEVAAEVIDGPQSRVFDEAENRLHAQKALLEWLIGSAT